MKRSSALTIRKFTLAPLLAAFMLIYLYIVQPEIFGSIFVSENICVLIRQLFFCLYFHYWLILCNR